MVTGLENKYSHNTIPHIAPHRDRNLEVNEKAGIVESLWYRQLSTLASDTVDGNDGRCPISVVSNHG
jgi:hypothetical protein